MNADEWPSPPPKPTDPATYRISQLGSEGVASQLHVRRITDHPEFYPEVQLAVLRLVADEPSPQLLARMATVLLPHLDSSSTPPSDRDRRHAIAVAQELLAAAAALPDSPDSKEPDFD